MEITASSFKLRANAPKGQKRFPISYKGGGFLLSWGAAGGDQTDKGQDLLLIKPAKKGDNYQMHTTQIAKSFQNPMDSVLIGNKLYVLDFSGKGAIWEITFPQ